MNNARTNRSMIARLAAVLACLIASAAFATPAAADAPIVTQHADSYTLTVTDLCGFPIRFDVVSDVTETNFFNRGGELIRQRLHIVEQDTLTANGKTAVGLPFTVNVELQFSGGNITRLVGNGIAEKIRLPDGTLFIAAGRIDFLSHPGVTFLITPDNGNPGNVAALCAALAP